MPNDYFMPRTDADKDAWLKNFAAKLPTYAAKYGIIADEVTDMQNSSAYYSYWLTYHQQHSEFNKKLTQYKAELRNYTDTAPLPANGQSAVWKYRCIYRNNDEQVGQWSDVASITVSSGI